MDPIRHILAATDLSTSGGQAVRRAAWLAASHGADLTLLHVDEPDALLALRNLLGRQHDLSRAVAKQADMELAALARQIEQQGVRVQRRLRGGNVIGELSAAASESDVLVLGARGASPIRELVLGTTAERLVRLARRPVAVVHAEPTGPYARVLVAVDFSAASEAALRFAMRLVPGAEFHLLHCYDVPFEGRQRLAGATDAEIEDCRDRQAAIAWKQFDVLAERLGNAPASRLLRRGNPRLELLSVTKELGADLVVVGKQGLSLVGDVLLGSLTSWAVTRSTCDVLVVPGTAAA